MKYILKVRGLDSKLVDACKGLHELKLVGVGQGILQRMDCLVDVANTADCPNTLLSSSNSHHTESDVITHQMVSVASVSIQSRNSMVSLY